MWELATDSGHRQIVIRDETWRDGGQGEAPRSAYRGIRHLMDTAHVFDMQTIGWIYTNPCDTELARYIREHAGELHAKNPHFNTDKLFVYTLVHRGGEATPEEVIAKDAQTPFAQMLRDLKGELQPGKQPPFGTVNILTKSRVGDLKFFGEKTTSDSFRKDIVNTISLLRKANEKVHVEIALEHIYTAWTEEANQAENRKHIVDTLADYLIATKGMPGQRITAPDTDGAHSPEEIARVIHEITEALNFDKRLLENGIVFDPSLFIAHMHDDLDHAKENSKAALEAGAGAMDLTVGIFGERKGNCTAAKAVEIMHTPHDNFITGYQAKLERLLGLRPGDKLMGSAEAFVGTGGMHADTAFKALQKARAEGKTYDWFVSHYNGSYATVPAHRFGQKLQMSLSPVAGKANVLFMLAGLGLNIDGKEDPRINDVLKEVKDGEFHRGMNYRGYNNANAMLLLADKFGLREDYGFADFSGKCRNRLHYALVADHDGYDSGIIYAGKLVLAPDTQDGTYMQKTLPSSHRDTGWRDGGLGHIPAAAKRGMLERAGTDMSAQGSEGADTLFNERMFDTYVAKEQLVHAKRHLTAVDARFAEMDVLESRRFEVPVGRIGHDGDPAHAKPEQMLKGVKLIFTTGTEEKFQANGAGETEEKAMGAAIQTMLDLKCFQIEQARRAAGESPIFDIPQTQVTGTRAAAAAASAARPVGE